MADFTRLSPQVYLYPGTKRPALIPENALALRHNSDQAFGDGSHPTTRLCAGAVDLLCRLQNGRFFSFENQFNREDDGEPFESYEFHHQSLR